MQIRIKKLHPDAHLPEYVKPGDVAVDLVAVSKIFDEYGNAEYGTGLSIDIPMGYVGLIFPRSNNSRKDLLLSDSVGVLSPGNLDEIILRYRPSAYFANYVTEPTDKIGTRGATFDYICFGKEYVEDEDHVDVYTVGDRIGQLLIIPCPRIEWNEVFNYDLDDSSNVS